MIAIVDYGVGNLFSLAASFRKIGAETVITSDRAVIAAADRVILPGVGAFGDAARKLRESGLDKVVKEEAAKGKPLMGICLGMQLLFAYSEEFGRHEGLGLLPGRVVPMKGVIPSDYKIPHIGWNRLSLKKEIPLFRHIQDGDHVYFVHSFYAEDCGEALAATTEYGAELTAAVAMDNVMGCQFHPEKSGDVGLNILRGFLEL
ncbi:MAG: imidazole glycerol phosphate synthase subunit HisH [Clostridia bacterium]|nr:imidazole glycerol phosphate synthase subunit HisH [Clostridia bacterium]